MTPLSLLKRLIVGRKLNPTEHDQNLTKIETSVNELQDLFGTAIKPDGSLADGAVDRPAAIGADVLEFSKFKPFTEHKGKMIGYGDDGRPTPLNSVANLFPKVFQHEEYSEVAMSGAQSNTTLNQWTIPNVPKGMIFAHLLLHAARNGEFTGSGQPVTSYGTVRLILGGEYAGEAPLHPLVQYSAYAPMPFAIVGMTTGFAGGDLSARLEVETAEANFALKFGVSGDGRFGRKLTFLAGLGVS